MVLMLVPFCFVTFILGKQNKSKAAEYTAITQASYIRRYKQRLLSDYNEVFNMRA